MSATDRVALTVPECGDRIVAGDWHETQGEMDEANVCRNEAAIGARVIRGPGDLGYNPMMATIMASMGRVHS